MCNRCNPLVPATKLCSAHFHILPLHLCHGWFVTSSLAVSEYLHVQVLTTYPQVQVLQEVLATSKYKYSSLCSASKCLEVPLRVLGGNIFVGGKDRRQISILSPWLEGGHRQRSRTKGDRRRTKEQQPQTTQTTTDQRGYTLKNYVIYDQSFMGTVVCIRNSCQYAAIKTDTMANSISMTVPCQQYHSPSQSQWFHSPPQQRRVTRPSGTCNVCTGRL